MNDKMKYLPIGFYRYDAVHDLAGSSILAGALPPGRAVGLSDRTQDALEEILDRLNEVLINP